MAAAPRPYVLAYSGEALPQPLEYAFSSTSAGQLRLSYTDPKPSDWKDGVLRARVRTNRQGKPLWRKLNTRRQWECIEDDLCQVCKAPASDGDGRIPWLLTNKVHQPIGESTFGTTAPPTCRACIPVSLAACPNLKSAPTLCTASHADQVGVLATVFRPGLAAQAVQAASNVFVGWEEFDLLDHALAMLLVVQLRDVRVEPL